MRASNGGYTHAKFADYQLSALDKANTRIPPKIFIFRDTEAPFTATESSGDFPTDESLKWRLYTREICRLSAFSPGQS